MKKFLLMGLVAAVAGIASVSQANAASRYCIYNPDDPVCDQGYGNGDYGQSPYYEPDYYGDNGYPPPPPRRPRYNDNGYDYGNNSYDSGPSFTLQFGSQPGSCSQIRRSLQRSGFRNVRSVDCAGREFAYLADRGGRRLRLVVGSNDGRIHKILRQ